MTPIKLLIVDDMEAHRRRLQRCIEKEEDLICVDTANSGYEAVLKAAMHQPDIILMDVQMEHQIAGIEAAKEINKNLPDIKIIVLTVHEDDNIVIAAFQTGIVDYMIKTASDEEIIAGIRAAHNNRSPIRPIIADKIRQEFVRIKSKEESLLYIIRIISELTPSELDVLKLLCEGKTRKQIAGFRCVEIDTIKKQITSILKKFDMKNTKEVVATLKELKIFDVLKTL